MALWCSGRALYLQLRDCGTPGQVVHTLLPLSTMQALGAVLLFWPDVVSGD